MKGKTIQSMEENIGGYLSDLKMEKYLLNKLH